MGVQVKPKYMYIYGFGKTVRSLDNTCHTWALLRWRFTKRRYIKCTYLYIWW